MAETITLDANILFYAIDVRDPGRQLQAEEVIKHASASGAILVAITFGEFFASAARKLGLSRSVVHQHLMDFSLLFQTASYDLDDVVRAARESEAGRFQFWDAVMLSAAERAGCTVCLSEDMADGATLGGITVRTPFGASGLSATARTALGIP
ncbi:MAG TPA: PIN domain-containing protein [Rhizomicrobium sp.]|nr:PIN domain-containing protein [Rhizomicrobium sp.]